jgi:KDO2-lipid IV(A) lauroyltransferase
MLVDQKLREGVAVPFFGRDAMTTPAPAVLTLKTKAHLLFASNKRLPGPRFHVTVWPDIDFAPTGNEAEDSHRLTAAITARIEEMIRVDPSQWLWIHNRWPTERDRRIMEGRKP